MKLLLVVGARPQFIKAAVITREIRKIPDLSFVMVHTGQHFDHNMSQVFFDEMEIPAPDYNLGIHGLTHGAMTGRMLEAIENVLHIEKPGLVVVFGDTNSTLAAALAAKKLGIPIAHVEAGVRNFDESMPEEINRYVVDRMADLNFCCTAQSMKNLQKEGFFEGNINSSVFNSGDVMYDAANYYREKALKSSRIIAELHLENAEFALCTVHRASNTDDPDVLRTVIDSLNHIHHDTRVVFPVHPRTRAKLGEFNIYTDFLDIKPVGYLDMLCLLSNAKYVLTDSGGIIREAYFYSKPSLFMMDKPPWPELVEEGACLNAAPEGNRIKEAFNALKLLRPDFSRKIYGNANAGEKIINEIVRFCRG